MKTKKLNIVICVLSLLVLVYFIFKDNGIQNISKIIQHLNIWWILGGFGCIVIYWLFESINLHIATKQLDNKQTFKQSIKVSMIGQLFNCITPFSSGGQPMQAYYMAKDGVSIGNSATALLAKFIIYQIVLTLYSLVILFLKYNFFMEHINGFIWLAIIGFAINTVVVLWLIFIAYFKKPTEKVIHFIIHILNKIKIIKNKELVITNVDKEIDEFYLNFKELKQHKSMMFKMFISTLIQLTVYFLIPYMIYKGLGLHGANIFNMLSAQAFVLMISSFVPLPGAAGGAEASFLILYGMFFPASMIVFVILIWRLFTFYLPILVGSIFLLFQKNVDKIEVPVLLLENKE